MSIQPAGLSISYILSFLTTHDWDYCVGLFGKDDIHGMLERDLNGTITLDAKGKTFNIHLDKITNASKWEYELPGSEVFGCCYVYQLG